MPWKGGFDRHDRPPEILYLKDTNGDGQGRHPTRCSNSGFRLQKPAAIASPIPRAWHRQLDLLWPMTRADGQDHFTPRPKHPVAARPVLVRGGRTSAFSRSADWRAAGVPAPTQFGLSFNDLGRSASATSNHVSICINAVVPMRYLMRSPALTVPHLFLNTSIPRSEEALARFIQASRPPRQRWARGAQQRVRQQALQKKNGRAADVEQFCFRLFSRGASGGASYTPGGRVPAPNT